MFYSSLTIHMSKECMCILVADVFQLPRDVLSSNNTAIRADRYYEYQIGHRVHDVR